MIEFSCGCGKTYTVKDEMAGRRGKCKECGAPILVPAKSGEQKQAPRIDAARSMPWDEGPQRKLSQLAKKCGTAPIYLLLASRRFFTGAGTVEFRDNVLCVRGTLGQDPVELSAYWLATVVIGNFVIAVIPIRVVLLWGSYVFTAACVVYLIFRLLSGREMKTIFVRPEKIESVTCNGPIVTIKFRAEPMPGLGSIRMFVSPDFRKTFFPEFHKIFPKALPEDYRAAVDKTKAAEPEIDEY